MALTERQLAPYLLETREIVELMLGRFAEIRELSKRWVGLKDSEDDQLGRFEAGERLDDDTWRETLWARGDFQAKYFSALEAFLAGWARLSLLLFPVGGKDQDAEFRENRGSALRDALRVDGGSVLEDRGPRDAWMHFDERLDRAIVAGTFSERHRFLRSNEAKEFVASTLVLLEVDALIVHYPDRSGARALLKLADLEKELITVRKALRETIAG